MFLFSSGSSAKPSVPTRHTRPYMFVNPDDDDSAAQKELEAARLRWNSLVTKYSNVWDEQWLWDNRNSPLQSSGPLRKKFLQMFNSKVKMRKRIKSLIRGGVPPEFRGNVWSSCAGSNTKKALASPDEQYQVLLTKIHRLDGTSIAVDIEKDLLRTFPDRIATTDTEFISSLRNVLYAYAVRNNRIGYCQSMNYLCGLLLLHMDEEPAFWTLSALIEDILPPNYYSASLLGGRIDQQVFQSCLAWKLPKIYEVFRNTNTMLEPVICPWFLCLYVNVIPLYAVCRIWDCLFWEGSTVLFRIGLTMIKSKSHELLRARDFITIYGILKNSAQPSSCSFVLERAPDSISGSSSGTTRRTLTDDGSGGSLSHSGSNTSFSSSMSDGEFLIQSAFGYRWLKSVPQSKVDELRKRFLELMTISEDLREKERIDTRNKSLREAATAATSVFNVNPGTISGGDSDPQVLGGSEPAVTTDPIRQDVEGAKRRIDRKSQIMLRMLDTHDLNALMELARECGGEGMDSHVEEFAREFTTLSESSGKDGADEDGDGDEDDDSGDGSEEESNDKCESSPK